MILPNVIYDSHGKQIKEPWDVTVSKIENFLFFINATSKVWAYQWEVYEMKIVYVEQK